MDRMSYLRYVSDAAIRSMRDRKVEPTPRNFELWYSYHSEANPRLRESIDEAILATKPFTPGVMQALHHEFLAAPEQVAAIKDSSLEMRDIATRMADHVTTNHEAMANYGTALTTWMHELDSTSSVEEVMWASKTLRTAAIEANVRIQELEVLLKASVSEIDDLTRKLTVAENASLRDPLTGLANRRMFDAALLQATTAANQDGSDVALLFLDIDHFKKFNDNHGHAIGDSVLRLFADGLKSQVKGRDTAARYGGEEFVTILVGTGLDAAKTVAEQIRASVEARDLINRKTSKRLGNITCSVGVAAYRHGEAIGDFIDRADKAVYAAKSGGRNRVCG